MNSAFEVTRCPKCGRELDEQIELSAAEAIGFECGYCEGGY